MKILMVCLGNICRSPLAHGILAHIVKREGLVWEIDSAGTGDWHVGQAPDRRSIAVAKQHGIDISDQRAQHFTQALFQHYDRILVMDKQNYSDVLSLASSEEDKNKVFLFIPNDMVPDPYYDNNLFLPVFQLIENRCKELISELKEQ